jgi:uncharacterized protein
MHTEVYGEPSPAYESLSVGHAGDNRGVATLRIAVRVKPGASRTRVGGRYDGPEGTALVVAVAARAVDGRANKAVVVAVAQAFSVRRSDVRLVRGTTGRYKLFEVDGPEELRDRYVELLG